jgi:hypothetical protein
VSGVTIAVIIVGYLIASVIIALVVGRFIAAGSRHRIDDQ